MKVLKLSLAIVAVLGAVGFLSFQLLRWNAELVRDAQREEADKVAYEALVARDQQRLAEIAANNQKIETGEDYSRRIDEGQKQLSEQFDSIFRTEPEISRKEFAESLFETIQKSPKRNLPMLFVLPPIDSQRNYVDDSESISHLATLLASFSPWERYFDGSFKGSRRMVEVITSIEPNHPLEPRAIDIIRSEVDSAFVVLPVIDKTPTEYVLTLEITDPAGTPQTTTQRFPMSEFLKVPGQIALAIRDAAGLKVDDAERERLLTSHLSHESDFGRIIDETTDGERHQHIHRLEEFIQRNPNCDAIRDDVLAAKASFSERLRHAKRAFMVKFCTERRLCMAGRMTISLFEMGYYRAALKYMKDHIEWFADDDGFCANMLSFLFAAGEEELADRWIAIWIGRNDRFYSRLRLASALRDTAWDSRGSGWANEVPAANWKRFSERLSQAEKEFRKALRAKPNAWHALRFLMMSAKEMGLPASEVEEMMDEMIRQCPNSPTPYFFAYTYYQPRWGGSNAALARHARRCIETDNWKSGIPQIAFDCLKEISLGMDSSLNVTRSEVPEDLWYCVSALYEHANDPASFGIHELTPNLYMRWAGCSSRHQEFLAASAVLEKHPDPYPLMLSVWHTEAEYQFFRDKANVGTAPADAPTISAVRLALRSGDWQRAGTLLEKLPETDDSEPNEQIRLDRGDELVALRRAVDLGRRLDSERKVELTGSALFDVLTESLVYRGAPCLPLSTRPLSVKKEWSVDGDNLNVAMGTDAGIVSGVGLLLGTPRWKFAAEIVSSKAKTPRIEFVTRHGSLCEPVTLFLDRYKPDGATQEGYQTAIRTGLGIDRFRSIEHRPNVRIEIESGPSGDVVRIDGEKESPFEYPTSCGDAGCLYISVQGVGPIDVKFVNPVLTLFAKE